MKNSKWILILVVLLASVGLFLWAKKKSKKSNNPYSPEQVTPVDPNTPNPPNPNPNPAPPKPNTPKPNIPPPPKVSVKFSAVDQVKKIVSLLDDPFDFTGNDEKAFDIIIAYTNGELIAVDKEWRNQFPVKQLNGILYEWIRSEQVWARPKVSKKREQVLQRLRDLGLDN